MKPAYCLALALFSDPLTCLLTYYADSRRHVSRDLALLQDAHACLGSLCRGRFPSVRARRGRLLLLLLFIATV